MKSIIENSLTSSISYDLYRQLVETLIEHQATSGREQSRAFVEYTKLNGRRMKRWDKTIKIDEYSKSIIRQFETPTIWLVITESWCGDAAHMIPVLNKIAELNPNIELKLVFRDEHDSLMNQFLTDQSRSIPKLIMLDAETLNVLGTYGPRPSVATQMAYNFKKEHGKLSPEFKEDLQRWYNKNKGKNIIDDVVKLLTQVAV